MFLVSGQFDMDPLDPKNFPGVSPKNSAMASSLAEEDIVDTATLRDPKPVGVLRVTAPWQVV